MTLAGTQAQIPSMIHSTNSLTKLLTPFILLITLIMLAGCKGGEAVEDTGEGDKHPSVYLTHLDSELQKVVEKYGLMGLSVTLIADQEIAYEGIFGKALYEPARELTRNSVFRIASITKTTVTMGLMQLVEQGRVDPDADVSRYLGWELRNPKWPEEIITLRHLTGHTSGIRDGEGYGQFISEMYTGRLNIGELFQESGSHFTEDMFADHRPGQFFSYSNSAWSLVATVIEKISGERFDRYMRERIFLPLRMNASFNVTDFEKDEIATLYRKPDGVWTPQVDDYRESQPADRAYEGYEPGHNGLLYGPQGNLRMDTAALQTLALTLMNGGEWNGVRVLQEATVEMISSPNWIYDGTNGDTWDEFWQAYGLGIHLISNREGKDVIFPDRTMWGHPGIAYGLLSDMYIDPETGSGVIFVTTGSERAFETSDQSAFYAMEQEVFDLLYPVLKAIEEPSN